MDQTQAKAILSALSPEVLAERQRIVDAAVRAARDSGYCDQFNSMITLVLPEMTIDAGGYHFALNSEGRACNGTTLDRIIREYGGGVKVFDPTTGYAQDGYDRDGFDALGYDREGFDADGVSKAFTRERVAYAYDRDRGEYIRDTAVHGVYDHEQMYRTGYGRSTHKDRDGNRRIGRPATPEEVAAESATSEPFNPTTWSPQVLVSVSE